MKDPAWKSRKGSPEPTTTNAMFWYRRKLEREFAEDKIKVAWYAGLLPDICEDHPASGGSSRQRMGNILFFSAKSSAMIWRLRCEAGMRAIHGNDLLFKVFPPIHKSLVFIGNYNILDGKKKKRRRNYLCIFTIITVQKV